MGDGAHHRLGAEGELEDALREEGPVFEEPAPDGKASVCGGDVVLATFERH